MDAFGMETLDGLVYEEEPDHQFSSSPLANISRLLVYHHIARRTASGLKPASLVTHWRYPVLLAKTLPHLRVALLGGASVNPTTSVDARYSDRKAVTVVPAALWLGTNVPPDLG